MGTMSDALTTASGSAARRPPAPIGLLLVRGRTEAVVAWAARGLVSLRVVPLENGWCGLVPAEPTSPLVAPYDDPVGLLLGRPVPRGLRPSFGATVVHDQALLTATPGGWRAVQRWVAWRPGTGLVPPGGLPTLRLAALVHLAGVDDPGALAEVADIVHDAVGSPLEVLQGLLAALHLPGGDLLGTPAQGPWRPGSTLVPASDKGVAAFGRMVSDDASWRAEMGGGS
ncbi:MAG: hypothetical protein M3Y71_10535 [Actinomycetota bacterium]|nr:hypothetical protein [Actinomycetota bacterium]